MGDALEDDSLWPHVQAHLRRGPDSISGVARAVSSVRPRAVHRLTIAGYLQSLAEVGVIRRIERRPSILYALANRERHLSLHERLGRAVREAPVPEADRVACLVAALHRVLARPVFAAEVRHAGFDGPLEGVVQVKADEAQRRELRALLLGRPALPFDLPRGDPLLAPADPGRWHGEVEDLLVEALLGACDATRLAARGTPAQTALALDAA